MNKISPFFLFPAMLLCSILLYGCSSRVEHGTDKQVTALPAPAPPDVEYSISSTDENVELIAKEKTPQIVKHQENRTLPLDPAKSWVRIQVMKKGQLQNLGHNHVIENHNLTGEVVWDGTAANVHGEFSLPVEQFTVDDTEQRKQAGKEFEKEVSVNDILSIRRTMLSDRVLAAADFPAIKIVIQGVSAPSIDQAVDLTLTIRGKTKTVRTAARVYMSEGVVYLEGRLRLKQSDFGITPVTILMGKLTIEDTIQIEYHLEAGVTQ